MVFSASSSHYHYVRDYERWKQERIEANYVRARWIYRRLGALDALLHHEPITLAYTFSRWARETYLSTGLPEWKIRVIYPGFDISPPPPRPARADVVFLFLGRAPRRKGGDLVLDAFRRLRATTPSVRLLYVTDEQPPEPIAGVEARPLVPAFEVAPLYRQADVFVSPTRAEGFGFTNVEAQGHGLPVISTRLGAIPEVVDHGTTGWLIDPDDITELLHAMNTLARDAQMRARMSEAARRNFVRRFGIGIFRAALGDIYGEAIDRSRFAN